MRLAWLEAATPYSRCPSVLISGHACIAVRLGLEITEMSALALLRGSSRFTAGLLRPAATRQCLLWRGQKRTKDGS